MGEMQFGMVGLGVMGQNLALNMAEKGFPVAGWDAWPEPVDKFVAKAGGLPIQGYKSLPEFVASLRRPRRIIILVKAGEVVDQTIAHIAPLLEHGDMLIDGGNEHFLNTERRAKDLAAKGIRFFGMGVSGGEEGARHGPSLMPGGDRGGYDDMAPILTKIAAQVEDGPCVTYIGPGGSGHYVKMVHNGIEYGDMQLIAEAYDVLKCLGGLSNDELSATFDEWNRGELKSFLIEITAHILSKKDPEAGGYLVDYIVDSASQKGTGKWMVQEAADLGVPIPTITSAVDARLLSSDRKARLAASEILPGPKPVALPASEKARLVADVRAGLYAAKACSYAQGMGLLRVVSNLRKWDLKLSEIARIWKGGCIIRAQFLGRIQAAYQGDPGLSNLLLDGGFVAELGTRQDAWRRVIGLASASGIPLLTFGSSLAYYDMIRRARLPANLTQAQRDYFGAHTYERLDRPGTFHTEWTK
jgi:6-phosphogluconate dehydrogenase